jgi:multidrug efflux system membrane fusion protein
VYLVNANETVSVHKVTLGASDGRNTAILSGLTAGDTVVVDGTDRLSDGAQISVSTAAAPAAGTPQVPATPGSPPGSKARKKPSAAAQGASATS